MFKMNCSQCGEMYYIGAGCPCWKKYTVPTYNVPISIPKNQIKFWSDANNTWVMRITADRRIEVNEGVEVTEAAQKVLDAMQQLLTKGLDKAVADEREACAKLCDSFYESWINIHGRYEFMGEGAQECAAAIRARGQA